MHIDDFRRLRDEIVKYENQVSDDKGEDYRIGNSDALHNFKNVGESLGIDPMIVLGIYMKKHLDAIYNFIKSGGQSESEPIVERIVDARNYLMLFAGMVVERGDGDLGVLEDILDGNLSFKIGDKGEVSNEGDISLQGPVEFE